MFILYFPQAGVSKLTDAKVLVDELKKKAAEQSVLLAQKQEEADSALKEITVSLEQKILHNAHDKSTFEFRCLWKKILRLYLF